MECPGFAFCADAAILQIGHLSCRSGMHLPLRITIEERQVECLVHAAVAPTIGEERIDVTKEIVRPGTSAYGVGRGSATSGAYYSKVREQAHTPKDASCDDHNHKPNQQRCIYSRKTPVFLLDWHGWLKGR